MSASSDDPWWRAKQAAIEEFIASHEAGDVAIYCVGRPACPFRGKEAARNAEDGCPNCRRFFYNADGSTTEYRIRKH